MDNTIYVIKDEQDNYVSNIYISKKYKNSDYMSQKSFYTTLCKKPWCSVSYFKDIELVERKLINLNAKKQLANIKHTFKICAINSNNLKNDIMDYINNCMCETKDLPEMIN